MMETLGEGQVDTTVCDSAAVALFLAGELSPDLVVASTALSGIGCPEFVGVLRSFRETPIYVSTDAAVKDGSAAALQALEAGANAFIWKPYRANDAVVLLNSARRWLSSSTVVDGSTPPADGRIVLDVGKRTLRIGNRPIALSQIEFDLLFFFMRNPYRTLTRRELHDEVWGAGYQGGIDIVTVHTRRLRRRIGDHRNSSRIIETVRGRGYRFIAPVGLWRLDDSTRSDSLDVGTTS
jgi:DNA-binding response OmpR family regulator